MDHEHAWIKTKSLEIVYLILSKCQWRAMVLQLKRDKTIPPNTAHVSFLQNSDDLNKLVQAHLNCMKHTALPNIVDLVRT